MRKFIVKSVSKIKSATIHSIDGLKAAFKNEFAFRLELLIGAIALPLALFLGNTGVERALLISTLLLVCVAELLNSAIETTLNRIDLAWHPLTKIAKDTGSAAVMIALINVVVVWAIIIISHFI